MIYLRHSVHGTKVATMEMEAVYDEENGWTRYDPDTPSAPAAADVQNGLVSRRRGRPPRQQQEQVTDDDSGRAN
jgi:hypothetical protein